MQQATPLSVQRYIAAARPRATTNHSGAAGETVPINTSAEHEDV